MKSKRGGECLPYLYPAVQKCFGNLVLAIPAHLSFRPIFREILSDLRQPSEGVYLFCAKDGKNMSGDVPAEPRDCIPAR